MALTDRQTDKKKNTKLDEEKVCKIYFYKLVFVTIKLFCLLCLTEISNHCLVTKYLVYKKKLTKKISNKNLQYLFIQAF